ncbi:MAG: ferritin family protein [Candidatus Krumholzibacteria bacterium]|jgi:rubrerythrin|nr:ferritin family protein [Candidatus Krumholzibacteria bacterium]
MDIFEFALKMEEDGRDLYLEIARGSGDEGIKSIFLSLAADEERHRDAIRKMRKGLPEIEETEVLSTAKNVFEEIRDSGEKIDIEDTQPDLYRKARDIEDRSVKFYDEKAGEEKDHGRKRVFKALAAEERKHYFLLDHLVEFVSRPETWVEDAEFNHLEEY